MVKCFGKGTYLSRTGQPINGKNSFSSSQSLACGLEKEKGKLFLTMNWGQIRIQKKHSKSLVSSWSAQVSFVLEHNPTTLQSVRCISFIPASLGSAFHWPYSPCWVWRTPFSIQKSRCHYGGSVALGECEGNTLVRWETVAQGQVNSNAMLYHTTTPGGKNVQIPQLEINGNTYTYTYRLSIAEQWARSRNGILNGETKIEACKYLKVTKSTCEGQPIVNRQRGFKLWPIK